MRRIASSEQRPQSFLLTWFSAFRTIVDSLTCNAEAIRHRLTKGGLPQVALDEGKRRCVQTRETSEVFIIHASFPSHLREQIDHRGGNFVGVGVFHTGTMQAATPCNPPD